MTFGLNLVVALLFSTFIWGKPEECPPSSANIQNRSNIIHQASTMLDIAKSPESSNLDNTTSAQVFPLQADKNGNMGQLIVHICGSKACYDSDGAPPNKYLHTIRLVLKPDQKSAHINLPINENDDYSVFIHHDRNGDNEIENETCGLFGKPRDGIGFSNNLDPRDVWGKPSWNQVKIKPQTLITIHPIYMCD